MPYLIPYPYNVLVYLKSEVDDALFLKADKVEDGVENNIAGLTGEAPLSNLLDTGFSIDDLLPGNLLDGGVF